MAAAKKPAKKTPAKLSQKDFYTKQRKDASSKKDTGTSSKIQAKLKAKPAAKQDDSPMSKITGAAKGLLAKLPSADQVETAISPGMSKIRKMGKSGS